MFPVTALGLKTCWGGDRFELGLSCGGRCVREEREGV